MGNKKIIITTHYLFYGAAHALKDYLLDKQVYLLFITLPLLSQRYATVQLYRNQKLTKENRQKRTVQISFFDYILDLFLIIFWVLREEDSDLFIGVDPLNCLAGIFLRKIGKVKRVIFYSIDFVPVRFRNTFLNSIYHIIEVFCVKTADENWNVSPRIAQGRKKFLKVSPVLYPQKIVPIGIWNDKIKKRSFAAVKKKHVLFMGHLLKKQGVQMVIEALPLIKKKIPAILLLIIGSGEYEYTLKEQVKRMKLEKQVIFTGWIGDRKVIDTIISESAIAIATYMPEKERLYNFTYYADPTKIKDYLGAGLPIILTNISYNAKTIAKMKCGILVNYDKTEIAGAILSLLNNEDKLKAYRKNAELYAKEFEWKRIFDKALYGYI